MNHANGGVTRRMGCCEDGAVSDLRTADDGILRFLLVPLRWELNFGWAD